VRRVLTRKSLFKRKAAGTDHRIQLLAANVDTVLIVSSCNQDFNPARIERYLALAREAEVEPVVILTKADLADDPADYVRQASRLAPGLLVETFDARESVVVERLAPWLKPGQTLALMGSSGVGKSTLVNTLSGSALDTQGIREDDAKGRHTTTARSLYRLAGGAWLVDMPGMRELQLADAEAGIDDLFGDIVALERQCRFSDCSHTNEPGCAVREAIAEGTLEPERLARFHKLQREDALNSATLAQRRAKSRAFGKMAKAVMEGKAKRRGDW
jgi:ribosome biogenesis GTPase